MSASAVLPVSGVAVTTVTTAALAVSIKDIELQIRKIQNDMDLERMSTKDSAATKAKLLETYQAELVQLKAQLALADKRHATSVHVAHATEAAQIADAQARAVAVAHERELHHAPHQAEADALKKPASDTQEQYEPRGGENRYVNETA